MKAIKKILMGMIVATAVFGFLGCSDSGTEEDSGLETIILADGFSTSTSRKVTMKATSEGAAGIRIYTVYTLDGSLPELKFQKDAWTADGSPALSLSNIRKYVDYGTAELYEKPITLTETTKINAVSFYMIATDLLPFKTGPVVTADVVVKKDVSGINDAPAPQTGNLTFKLASTGNTITTHYFDTSDNPFVYTYNGTKYEHCYYQFQFSWKGTSKGNWYLYVRQLGKSNPIGYVSADGKSNTNFLAKGVYEGPCLNSSDGTVTDGTLILKTLKGNIFGEATVSNSSFALAIDSNTANETGNVATAIQDAK